MIRLKLILGAFLIFVTVSAFGQARIGINGAVDWEKMEINAVVSLNLASAGLRMPAGRTQGEALISSEYFRLIRPGILNIQVDSSSTIADLIERGDWTLSEAENLVLQARTVPPSFSQDFNSLTASYSLGIGGISSALIRHTRPAQVPITLSPVSAPVYTGIIIIASDSLPVHGRAGTAFPQPCLFPKIWDTDMNLIFERNMLNPGIDSAAHYFHTQDIFAGGPSGLSPKITAVAGNRPLRIIARGVFGIVPTDPIISLDDTLLIISSEENRKLLSEGRIAIVLAESVLKKEIK